MKRRGSLLSRSWRLLILSNLFKLIWKQTQFILFSKELIEWAVWIVWPEPIGSWCSYLYSLFILISKKSTRSSKASSNWQFNCYQTLIRNCLHFWGITKIYGNKKDNFKASFILAVPLHRERKLNYWTWSKILSYHYKDTTTRNLLIKSNNSVSISCCTIKIISLCKD